MFLTVSTCYLWLLLIRALSAKALALVAATRVNLVLLLLRLTCGRPRTFYLWLPSAASAVLLRGFCGFCGFCCGLSGLLLLG
jgi:hypothetical protein